MLHSTQPYAFAEFCFPTMTVHLALQPCAVPSDSGMTVQGHVHVRLHGLAHVLLGDKITSTIYKKHSGYQGNSLLILSAYEIS